MDETNIKTIIAHNLAKIMAQKDIKGTPLTPARLSRLSGVNKTVLSNTLGEKSLISLDNLLKLRDALDISLDALVRGTSNHNSTSYDEGFIYGFTTALLIKNAAAPESEMDQYWTSLIGLNRNIDRLLRLWEDQLKQMLDARIISEDNVIRFAFLFSHFLDFSFRFAERVTLMEAAIEICSRLMYQNYQRGDLITVQGYRKKQLILRIDGLAYIRQEMDEDVLKELEECINDIQLIPPDNDTRNLDTLARLFIVRHYCLREKLVQAESVLASIKPPDEKYYKERYHEQCAELAYQRERYKVAEEHLLKITGEFNPKAWVESDDTLQDGAFARLMMIYHQMKSYDKAIQLYEVMKQRNIAHNLPSSAWFITAYEYGLILVDTNKKPEALTVFRDLEARLQSTPSFPNLYRYKYIWKDVQDQIQHLSS